MSDTLKLCLNRDKMFDKLTTYLEQAASTYEYKDLGKAGIRVVFWSSQELPPTTVDIKYLIDGTTSIIYNQGKNPLAGYDLANYIVKNTCFENDPRDNRNYTKVIENVNLTEYLKELSKKDYISIKFLKEDKLSNLIAYRIDYKDYNSCRLTFYPKTNRLLIQGKPLNAFYICSK